MYLPYPLFLTRAVVHRYIVELSPRILALSLHQEHTCHDKPRQERTALDQGIKMATHTDESFISLPPSPDSDSDSVLTTLHQMQDYI